ncbi:MAG: HEAT repeat domain-containing protein [Planctomycetota bacterium]
MTVHSSRLWAFRSVAALAVVALAVGAHAQASEVGAERAARYAWQGELDDEHRRVGSILREARVAGHEPGTLTERLAAPGPSAIPALLDVLVQARVPKSADTDAPQLLSKPQRALVVATLVRLPATDVRAELDARLSIDPRTRAVRIAALHVLGVIGTEPDLDRLGELARGADGEALDREERDALREAHAAFLRRMPHVLTSVEKHWHRRDPAANEALLLALGDLQEKRAMELIFQVARTDARLAQLALSTVRRTGASGNPEVDLEFARWLRHRTDPQRTEWTRAVLYALGELDEGESLDVLVDALSDAKPGLRDAAEWSLQKISGTTHSGDSDFWNAWRRRELQWMDRGRARCRSAFESSDVGAIVQALREYSGRRLFRSELVRDVVVLLERPQSALQELACTTLGELGSRAAVPALVQALASARPAVAEAAWRALTKVAGCEVPRDAEAAHALLALH